MNDQTEVLESLNPEELEALADTKLAPSAQQRLDYLLDRSSGKLLVGEEAKELHQILAKVDQLNVLKARARFTLRL